MGFARVAGAVDVVAAAGASVVVAADRVVVFGLPRRTMWYVPLKGTTIPVVGLVVVLSLLEVARWQSSQSLSGNAASSWRTAHCLCQRFVSFQHQASVFCYYCVVFFCYLVISHKAEK